MKKSLNDILEKLSKECLVADRIDLELYKKHNVKRGLRDLDGKGVLTGLTEISEINSFVQTQEGRVPIEGELFYRGINIFDLVEGFEKEERFGYEEAVYLLMFGSLPDSSQLKEFKELLGEFSALPKNFVRDVVMKATPVDMMNLLSRCVLTLFSYDDNPNDNSIENVLKQSLNLIALMPILSVYCYNAFEYYRNEGSFILHRSDPNKSIAENFLALLRNDSKYTALEARTLDLALVLHAEHGGGNNSTFTNHVVTSSGTDTYSAVVASLSSLKGPKHGGANSKVCDMMDDIKENVSDWQNNEEIYAYLCKILDKQAFDNSGLIYGMGHAVYSLSDPRAVILKRYAEKLCNEKGRMEEFNLYKRVERLAAKAIADKRHIYKGVSANVDFYSGLVYRTLDIPVELFTPLFASARISGWCAHRIEELVSGNKIIRPAYMSVAERREYKAIDER